MDLEFGPEYEAFRREVRSFLETHRAKAPTRFSGTAGRPTQEVLAWQKLLLERGADATVYQADRQTPIHAVLAGRANEKDAVELIKVLHDAGTDVNVVALIVHIEEVRGGSALHYAVRKRYKDVIRLLAFRTRNARSSKTFGFRGTTWPSRRT